MNKPSLPPSGRVDWTGQNCSSQPSTKVASLNTGYGKVWTKYVSDFLHSFWDISFHTFATCIQLEMKQTDLYLIHYPFAMENGDFERTWRGFERVKHEGLTKFIWCLSWLNFVPTKLLFRSIGVSNFNIEVLQRLLKIAHVKPAVNQVFLSSTAALPIDMVWMASQFLSQINLHPYSHAKHASLLAYHAKHGIVTEAYGSLAFVFYHLIQQYQSQILFLDQSQLSLEDPWTFQ